MTDDINIKTGAAVRQARIAKGKSQRELAGLMGCSRVLLSQMETGGRNWSLSLLAAAADALGVSPQLLVPPSATVEPRSDRRAV